MTDRGNEGWATRLEWRVGPVGRKREALTTSFKADNRSAPNLLARDNQSQWRAFGCSDRFRAAVKSGHCHNSGVRQAKLAATETHQTLISRDALENGIAAKKVGLQPGVG